MHKNTTFAAILRILRRYPLLIAAAVLVIAAAVGISLLPPLILADIVDSLAAGEMLSFRAALLYFSAIAFSGLLTSAREILLIVLGQKITHGLRTGILHKMNRLEARSLTQMDPGAFTARFSADVDTVQQLFTSGIISMLADGFQMISIFLLIAQRSAGLAFILCLVLPLIFLFTRRVQKAMLQSQIDYRKAVSRTSSHVPESIRCIRTIHTLQKEDYMEERYDSALSQAYGAMEKTNFFDSVYSPVILVTNALVVAAVMILASSGDAGVLQFFGMSAGTSVALINYISQIFGPIESLGMEIQTIQSAIAGVHRIDEFLAQEDRLQPDTRPYYAFEKGVSLQSVSFGYDESLPVLKDLSFSVAPGESITLAGRTGAGKSTVFKLLLGLYRASGGTVQIFGTDAAQIPDEDRRRLFGYVEQSFHAVPGTVKDQITLKDPAVTDAMAEKAACLVGLSEAIRQLPQGYDTPWAPELFSQGQCQLLGIARAVASDPKLLLLDEITANLDSETEHRVLEALHQASRGRTVLSVSHRIYDHTGGRLIHIGSSSGPSE